MKNKILRFWDTQKLQMVNADMLFINDYSDAGSASLQTTLDGLLDRYEILDSTGAEDETGKLIFEEDICTAKFKNKSGVVIDIKGKIIMDDFMWCIDCVDGIGGDIFSINRIHDIKVIGNAKANPELITE